MSSLTLEQAARASGRSARELRLLLEEGRLCGAMRAGRWLLEPSEVDGLARPAEPIVPLNGAGAAPVEAALRVPPPPPGGAPTETPAGAASASPAPAVEELVSRLEQRAIEVSRLRGDLEALREGRDEHGARVERELSGLRRELADAREELRGAHERIAELEMGDGAPAAEQSPQQRAGMSEALSPLFRPT